MEQVEVIEEVQLHRFRLGLTRTGLCNLFAFLFVISDGEPLKDDMLVERLSSPDSKADEDIEAYFARVVRLLKRMLQMRCRFKWCGEGWQKFFQTGGSTNRYVHPQTVRSVIVENAARKVMQVGNGFKF